VNLYYLTGMKLSDGRLLVHEKGAHLFVDGRYYENCQRAKVCTVVRAEPGTFRDTLDSDDFQFIETLGFDGDNTSYNRYLRLREQLSVSLLALDNPVRAMREIKDDGEIALLREAAALGSEGFDFVCSQLREGITEEEVARELEVFWKRKGGKALAFDPIIAFGAHSSMPHYTVGSRDLREGDVVLIDIGVNLQHYHSDMTRVVFFGKPHPELLAIYRIVQRAQEMALALCRPGTSVGELDAAARDFIGGYGFGEHFTHSLGHGVGLEIHESPTLRNRLPHSEKVLEEGMVITVEPGIYLPGVGGVRLEDTVVIIKGGHENLTNRPLEPLTIPHQ